MAALAAAGMLGAVPLSVAGPAVARTALLERPISDLCDRTEFTRSELNRIQSLPNYARILDYTLENCAPVAAVLSSGATASISNGAAATGSGGTLEDEWADMCDRDQFTRSELRAIQRRDDYVLLLNYTLDNCPAVAAVLSDVATATTTGGDNGNGNGGSGSGGGTGGGGGGGTGGGGTGGGGTGGGGTGGGDTGGGGTGGGDNGGGTGGGDNGGGDNGGGTGGGDNGGGKGCRYEKRDCGQ
jgi:hypothetical protein